MDKFWTHTVQETLKLTKGEMQIVAPMAFSESGLKVFSESADPESLEKCNYFVIHKGRLNQHSATSLYVLQTQYFPQFANDVFVVFGPNEIKLKPSVSRHLAAFKNNLGDVISKNERLAAFEQDRSSIYLGNNRAVTYTKYGHKMLVDTRDLSLAPHILLDGVWESWIAEVFLEIVKPGMSVVDVGSNLGYYSLLAADRVGVQGKLTCFEANPDLASLVFHNLHLNGFHARSEVVSKAAYSHSEILEFKIFGTYLGSSSLWTDEKHANIYHDSLKTIKVDAISLDEHFDPGSKIDFIKIDAEGSEPYILKGARRIIRENPDINILMEFVPSVVEVSYGAVTKYLDEISALGLRIFLINTDSTLKEFSLEDLNAFTWTDVVLKR